MLKNKAFVELYEAAKGRRPRKRGLKALVKEVETEPLGINPLILILKKGGNNGE